MFTVSMHLCCAHRNVPKLPKKGLPNNRDVTSHMGQATNRPTMNIPTVGRTVAGHGELGTAAVTAALDPQACHVLCIFVDVSKHCLGDGSAFMVSGGQGPHGSSIMVSSGS